MAGNTRWRYHRIARRDNGMVCRYCDAELGWRPGVSHPTLDHVIPLSCGGDNRDQNVVLACAPCNSTAENFGKRSYKVKRELLRRWGLPLYDVHASPEPRPYSAPKLTLGDLLTEAQRRKLGVL
jgi:hypothetical protein